MRPDSFIGAFWAFLVHTETFLMLPDTLVLFGGENLKLLDITFICAQRNLMN